MSRNGATSVITSASRSLRRGPLLLLSLVVVLAWAGCGGQPEEQEATAGDKIRDKLATCVSEWNSDGANYPEGVPLYGAPNIEQRALVTTDTRGECLVAIGVDGIYTPTYISGRNRIGQWSFQSEFGQNIPSSFDLQVDAERRSAPNAFVVDYEVLVEGEAPKLEFDPQAPLPTEARLKPNLLVNPRSKPCAEPISFSGGIAGPFSITVDEAAGYSCAKVARLVAAEFPVMVADWDCYGDEQLECGKGEVSFTLTRRQWGDEASGTAGPDSAPSQLKTEFIGESTDLRLQVRDGFVVKPGFEEWTNPYEGTEYEEYGPPPSCGSINFLPYEVSGSSLVNGGLGQIEASGMSCDDAIEVLMDWLSKDPTNGVPPGWTCEENGGGAHAQSIKCSRYEQEITFDHYQGIG